MHVVSQRAAGPSLRERIVGHAMNSAPSIFKTASIWAARSGAPGSRPSKIAPPIVKPQAPVEATFLICSAVTIDPATMTGPAEAATTACATSIGSSLGCR